MKPDGKLATICTMVMLLTTVISCMLWNDPDYTEAIVDAIKEHIGKFFSCDQGFKAHEAS